MKLGLKHNSGTQGTQQIRTLQRNEQYMMRRFRIIQLFLQRKQNLQIYNLLKSNHKTFQEIPEVLNNFINTFLKAVIKKLDLYDGSLIVQNRRRQNINTMIHGERKKNCGKVFLALFLKIAKFYVQKRTLDRIKRKLLQYIWKTLCLPSLKFSNLNEKEPGGIQQTLTKAKEQLRQKNPRKNRKESQEEDTVKMQAQESQKLQNKPLPENEDIFKNRLIQVLRQIARNQLFREQRN